MYRFVSINHWVLSIPGVGVRLYFPRHLQQSRFQQLEGSPPKKRHRGWLLGVNTHQEAVSTKMAKSERILVKQDSICYRRGLLQFLIRGGQVRSLREMTFE